MGHRTPLLHKIFKKPENRLKNFEIFWSKIFEKIRQEVVGLLILSGKYVKTKSVSLSVQKLWRYKDFFL